MRRWEADGLDFRVADSHGGCPLPSEQSARASEDIVRCMAGKYQEIRSPEKYFCDELHSARIEMESDPESLDWLA